MKEIQNHHEGNSTVIIVADKVQFMEKQNINIISVWLPKTPTFYKEKNGKNQSQQCLTK